MLVANTRAGPITHDDRHPDPGTAAPERRAVPVLLQGPFARLNTEPDVANFAVGNPQEMPLPEYVAALQRQLEPQDKDWFAYKLSEPESQRTVAATLSRRTGLDWDPDDVAMTNGGFAALAVAMRTLRRARRRGRLPVAALVLLRAADPRGRRRAGAGQARPAGLRPRRRPHRGRDRPRTRAVLVNSPHNPTGRVYSPRDPRRRSPRAWPMPASASAIRSGSSATSRTTGSCSTGASPQPGRGLPPHDHHLLVRQDSCWRPGSASAT